MAIMGFGGGAMIASPLSSKLLGMYDDSYDTATGIASGSAVAQLFVTLGAGLPRADDVRRVADPRAGGRLEPAGLRPFDGQGQGAWSRPTTSRRRTRSRLRSSGCCGSVLFCNVTAGIGILEQASPMIQDFFRDGSKSTVAAARPPDSWGCSRCSTWRAVSSGRRPRTWSGRKNVYVVYLGVGVDPLHLAGLQRVDLDDAVRPDRRESSSASTAVGSPRHRRTCATCSARSRSVRSTAGS